MNWLVRLAWAAVVATLLVALLLGAFLAWGLTEWLPAGTAIVIDGERFVISDIAPAHAGHWLMAALGVLVVAAVIVVVVPIVIVLSVGAPMLLGAFGLAVGLLMLALMLSPLILLIW